MCLGRRILFFGGKLHSFPNDLAFGKLAIWHIDQDRWENVALSGVLERSQSAYILQLCSTLNLYICLTMDVTLSGPPCVRQGHACGLANGKMVVFGGQTCLHPGNTDLAPLVNESLVCDTFILDLHRRYKSLKPPRERLTHYMGDEETVFGSSGDYLRGAEVDKNTRFC